MIIDVGGHGTILGGQILFDYVCGEGDTPISPVKIKKPVDPTVMFFECFFFFSFFLSFFFFSIILYSTKYSTSRNGLEWSFKILKSHRILAFITGNQESLIINIPWNF